MTVKELRDLLDKEIEKGNENLEVKISHYEKEEGYCGDNVYYIIDGLFKNTAFRNDKFIELEKIDESWVRK